MAELLCVVYWPQMLQCPVVVRNLSVLCKAFCTWASCPPVWLWLRLASQWHQAVNRYGQGMAHRSDLCEL